jgi:AraC family transcriptional regulator
MLAELVQRRDGLALELERGADEPGVLSPRQMARIREYLESHIDENISLIDLAKLVNISPSHFIAMFKRTVGATPHQWVISRRIDYAKVMLGHDDLSITDVAYLSGFSSPSHFTATFRRLVGTTPTRWRR